MRYLRATSLLDHFVSWNIMLAGFRIICVRPSCTSKVVGSSIRARKLHAPAWGTSRHRDAIPPPKYITGGTSRNRTFPHRRMSSNHPDENAEGGKFTGKVKHSGRSVLTVEYWEAKANASWKVPNPPRGK